MKDARMVLMAFALMIVGNVMIDLGKRGMDKHVWVLFGAAILLMLVFILDTLDKD